jgi:predicted transcriptional regulator
MTPARSRRAGVEALGGVCQSGYAASVARASQSRDELLAEILAIVRRNPGTRASEINRKLGREQTDHYRSVLIDQGLLRKERQGAAVRYYPAE